ncbi:hypothetical protein Y023_330 [Burkholderia pseudomallei A79D]|nr:hypothetical protein Y023_330 [Burkholderia pseudomallei A79D]KGY06553.1 hypothetical protein X997_325 [Burkholderia pseudomallei A79C]
MNQKRGGDYGAARSALPHLQESVPGLTGWPLGPVVALGWHLTTAGGLRLWPAKGAVRPRGLLALRGAMRSRSATFMR